MKDGPTRAPLEAPRPAAEGVVFVLAAGGLRFMNGEIADDIVSALKEGGLRATNLSLESTESTLVEDVVSAVAALERLENLGVQVEIDNFGTGYSSLSYLKRFPADFLKLDNSFVGPLGGTTREWTRLSRARWSRWPTPSASRWWTRAWRPVSTSGPWAAT